MKIVMKDNFDRDLFTEVVIAKVENETIGKEMVHLWNEMYWDEHSDFYLELVEEDYEPYDGYANLL